MAASCSVGDLDALWIFALIEFGADLEAGVGGGCGDQLDDGAVAAERLAPPVDGDEREQAGARSCSICWRQAADGRP